MDKVAKKVVSLKGARKLMIERDIRKLNEMEDLKVFTKVDVTHTALFFLDSDEMFKYVDVKPVKFVTFPERVVVKGGTVYKRSNKETIVNEFSVLCHSVVLKGKKKCYLGIKRSENVSPLEYKMGQVGTWNQTKDTSALAQFMRTKEIRFTQADFTVIKTILEEDNLAMRSMSENILLKLDALVSEGENLTYTSRSFHTGYSNFVKNLESQTLKVYGSRIAHMIAILQKCDKLPVLTRTDNEVAVRVAKIFRDHSLFSDVVTGLGKEISKVCETNEGARFWTMWIYLGCFDFSSWEAVDRDCPWRTMLEYRYMLDSLSWLIRFSTVNYSEKVETFIHKWTTPVMGGDDFVGNFKKLYYAVSKDAKISTSTYVNVLYESRSVMVKNRMLSFGLIGTMLREMTSDFDECLHRLSQWLKFYDFNMLYFNSLGREDIKFSEDYDKDSILGNFSDDFFIHMNMRWRNLENESQDESILKRIRDICNKLNRLIMVMVWICTGMPMRSPELTTITYAGAARNIFIDTVKRRLYLNIKYNKSHKYTNRVMFLSEGVSRRLWWSVTILRTFIYVTFGEDMSKFNTSVLTRLLKEDMRQSLEEYEEFYNNEDVINEDAEEDVAIVDNIIEVGNQRREDASRTMVRMFAFIDIKNLRLMDLKQLSNLLKCYPKMKEKKENHTIGTWRQAIAAMWKHFIRPTVETFEQSFQSNKLGNSEETFSGFYGVDRQLMDGDEMSFEQTSRACESFQKMIIADSESLSENNVRESAHYISEIMDNYDLLESGNQYFNVDNFQFRNEEQKDFTTCVLLGTRKVVGLQAPTAFGKSSTFILPILTLKRCSKLHYVHFVCVPYQALKLATITKLERGGLVVKDISFLKEEHVFTDIHRVDAYVGCSESFVDGKVGPIFKNWNVKLNKEDRMGFLIFDEAHTLFLDATYRPAIRNIKELNWYNWRKIVLLSATMPKFLFERILKDRHIPETLRKECQFVNCVKTLPVKDIESGVERVTYSNMETRAIELIKLFVEKRPQGKAVFFFSNKKTMYNVYSSVRSMNEVVSVNADCKEVEKTKVFRDFENEYSQTRVILGTKLLSNGLDCKSVQFICLVECSINCVDYLQMVGRIREWGYVRVLTQGGSGPFKNTTEVSRIFPFINWDNCISQHTSNFYNIEYSNHRGCCFHSLQNRNISELKKALKVGGEGEEEEEEEDGEAIAEAQEEISNFNNSGDTPSDNGRPAQRPSFDSQETSTLIVSDTRTGEAEVEGSECSVDPRSERVSLHTEVELSGVETSTPDRSVVRTNDAQTELIALTDTDSDEDLINLYSVLDTPVTKYIKDQLRIGDTPFYQTNINTVFGCNEENSVGYYILGIDPIYILKWEGEVPPNLCESCLMESHGVYGCGVFNQSVGKIVYQYLAIVKIVRTKDELNGELADLIHLGSHLYLLKKLKKEREKVRDNIKKLDCECRRKTQFIQLERTHLLRTTSQPIHQKFRSCFNVLVKNKVNILRMVVIKQWEKCPLWYQDIDHFYSHVFSHRENIEEIVDYNDSGMFAEFKKNCLADIEAWFRNDLKENKIEALTIQLIGSLENIPVLVTAIWAVFESKKYNRIIKEVLIMDHYCLHETFPIFARSMFGRVKYEDTVVPLYAVVICFVLGI